MSAAVITKLSIVLAKMLVGPTLKSGSYRPIDAIAKTIELANINTLPASPHVG